MSARAYSDMPASSVPHYENHALHAAAVVAGLVALATPFKQEHQRGPELGLRDDELAFSDAICQTTQPCGRSRVNSLSQYATNLVMQQAELFAHSGESALIARR